MLTLASLVLILLLGAHLVGMQKFRIFGYWKGVCSRSFKQ